MNEAKVRVILRWVHVVLGLAIMCYVYSPFHRFIFFQIIVKFVIIPVITFTGLWVWKFKQFNKFFHIRS